MARRPWPAGFFLTIRNKQSSAMLNLVCDCPPQTVAEMVETPARVLAEGRGFPFGNHRKPAENEYA